MSVTLRKVLLACGVAYSVLYAVVNDVVAATLYEGYSRTSQAISELSATAAPTRVLLTATLPVFTVLMIAFGIGVWMSAEGNRALRAAGGTLVAHGATFPLWLFAPMTSREQMGATMPVNDIGHIVLTVTAILLILSQIGFAAAAFGKRFRIYSLLTAATVVGFGALTGTQAPNVARGGTTQWMGLYERISFAAWLLWVAVLAITLFLHGGARRDQGSRQRDGKRQRRRFAAARYSVGVCPALFTNAREKLAGFW